MVARVLLKLSARSSEDLQANFKKNFQIKFHHVHLLPQCFRKQIERDAQNGPSS